MNLKASMVREPTVRRSASERLDLIKTQSSSSGISTPTSISMELSQTDVATGELASQTVRSAASTVDPLALFRGRSVITVIGRIEDWTLGWAGRIRCTLCLSIGDLPLTANRDTLPLEIQNGRWVRARVLPVSYTHLRAHETRHDLVCR